MRVSILIEAFIDVEVPGDDLADAVESAKKLKITDIIKVKKGETVDWNISTLGVSHDWPSTGDSGE